MSFTLVNRLAEASQRRGSLDPPNIESVKLQTDFVDKGKVWHYFNDAEELWTTQDVLGSGGFGVVVLEKCTSALSPKTVGKLRAVKRVKKPSARNAHGAFLEREILGMMKFSHPKFESHFVKFLGWYSNKQTLYLAMGYMPHGDLGSYLESNGPLPEAEVKVITWGILGGLRHMHLNDFAHRDIKPGNILIHSKPPQPWWVKLGDFGLSREFAHSATFSSGTMGTIGFMAPELLHLTDAASLSQIQRAQKADIWATGETVVRLLADRPTFGDRIDRMKEYVDGVTNLRKILGSVISPSAIDFLQTTMDPSPKTRPGITSLRNYSWVQPRNELQKSNFRFREHLDRPFSKQCPAAVFYPNGKLVVIWTPGSTGFELYSLSHPYQRLDEVKCAPSRIHACTIAPDGQTMAIAVQSDKKSHEIIWMDTNLLQETSTFNIGQQGTSEGLLAISPNSVAMAYACDCKVWVFGYRDVPVDGMTVCYNSETFTDMKFDPTGEILVIATNRAIQLHERKSKYLDLVNKIPYPESEGVGAIAPDCQGFVFTSKPSGNVYVWRTELECWILSYTTTANLDIKHLSYSNTGLSILKITEHDVVNLKVQPFGNTGIACLGVGRAVQGVLHATTRTLALVRRQPNDRYSIALYDVLTK